MNERLNEIGKETEMVYFTRYRLKDSVGGGGRRALQIIDELDECQAAYVSGMDYRMKDSLATLQQKGYKNRFYRYLFSLIQKWGPLAVLGRDYRKWEPGWRRTFFWFWRLSRSWAREIDEMPQLKTVVIEDPCYYTALVTKLKRKGISIVAVPQNIDTLFESYCRPKYRFELMEKELYWLRQCNLVLTNSREEAFFYRNNNINALFHKFHPTRTFHSRMLHIRAQREKSKKKDFILLGNAGNEATRNGMSELIKIWKRYISNETLYIIGFNTEYLKESADHKQVVFLGPLSDNDLDMALETTKAVICYQKSGPGALTRIAEMLTADIPVIGNSHAVRSYYHQDGIFEFDTVTGFVDVIRRVGNMDTHPEIRYEPPGSLKRLLESQPL